MLAGALLPDLPLLLYYLWARLGAGLSEAQVWSKGYFEDGPWQDLIDACHAFPLLLPAWLAARWAQAEAASALLASMLLHAGADFLLHHDDAHRQLFPLSDWRFRSPVSYWDPRYHGAWASVAEAALVLIGGWWLAGRAGGGPRGKEGARARRLAVLGLVAAYAAYWAFALLMWAG
ncbi:MAG: hypothetical protein D6809_00965 [Gammaproteobacteria bacterium]|nr:MAG: hypothetical protein D6809_00965 [Gammaproteobacteria bacterium]